MLTSDSNNKSKTIRFVRRRGKRPQSFAKRVVIFYMALMGVAWLTIWFSQKSINAYWQQTYHRSSPFEPLEALPFWRAGADVQEWANGLYDGFTRGFKETNDSWVMVWKPVVKTAVYQSEPNKPAVEKLYPNKKLADEAEAAEKGKTVAVAEQVYVDGVVMLAPGDKVLFAGDSMMQGVAPHLQKMLRSEHEVDSINLSKQSTGLAYPKFFDWPGTIEQTFQSEPNLKLVVILVGANDPWDFPDPDKPNGIPYLKFESEAWEKEYLRRVDQIINTADKAGAKVIWLGIPNMKREKLDKQMVYLNALLEKAIKGKKKNVLWLEMASTLSNGSLTYHDSIMIDNENVRVRTKDGIHFTTEGQKFVAGKIAELMSFEEVESDNSDEVEETVSEVAVQ